MHQTTKSEEENLHARVTQAAKSIDVSGDPSAAIEDSNMIATSSLDPTLTPDNTVEAWGEDR